jgi:2',3'-cyclic-nucleotide 2'-phosphodiesterase/3'-nucleotidase
MRLRLVVLFQLICVSLSGREIPITILHTCDLHGNVLPTENYEARANLGGIARCATKIRQVRSQANKVLLVDAGDTIQGAAVGYLTGGQSMVKAMNELQYDAWVWGNHEFDWGLEKLADCADLASSPILTANLQRASTNAAVTAAAARILARRKDYILRDVDGVKVAIIGLTTPGIPNWSRPRLIGGLKFEDSIETLRRLIPAVRRAGAQVLVLVCHQGYREQGDDQANQINAIAQNFPELDVIIGAHTHRCFPELRVGNVLYCQAEHSGDYLGRVDLVYDTVRNRVIRRSAQTILMDDQVALDPGLMTLLKPDIDRARETLSTVIGWASADFGIDGAPRRETAIHNLICGSISEALRGRGVTVDVVVHGILDLRATLRKGPVTVGDIWRVVPYENTVGVLQLTSVQLKLILEENASAYDKREFRGVWGVSCQLDPKRQEGARILSLRRANGTILDENQRLDVAFNSYDLAGAGMRWKRLREKANDPSAHLVEYDLQVRQALIDYIRSHREVSPQVGGWWDTVRQSRSSSPSTLRLP